MKTSQPNYLGWFRINIWCVTSGFSHLNIYDLLFLKRPNPISNSHRQTFKSDVFFSRVASSLFPLALLWSKAIRQLNAKTAEGDGDGITHWAIFLLAKSDSLQSESSHGSTVVHEKWLSICHFDWSLNRIKSDRFFRSRTQMERRRTKPHWGTTIKRKTKKTKEQKENMKSSQSKENKIKNHFVFAADETEDAFGKYFQNGGCYLKTQRIDTEWVNW